MAKVYLAQLGTFKNGLNFSAEKVGSGCKMVGIPDFGDRYIVNIEELREIDRSIVTEEYLLKNGDILFVRSNGNKALVGRTMLISDISEDVTFSGFCIRFRPDLKKVSPLYLLYLFKSPFFRRYFSNTQQTSINNLNQEVLGGIEIDLPKREEQERLIKGIHAITKKISSNFACNDRLQQQLKLIYDYWFTQFDFPDGKGLPYRSSGGAMIYSEVAKRTIPDGWKAESVLNNSLSQVIKPGVEHFNKKIYLATAEVNRTNISAGNIIEYETRESRANMQPVEYSVWFAKMKNSVKHLYLNKEMEALINNSILSTGFCGLQCTEYSFEYMASFVEHSYFETVKDILAHGATQEAVNNDDLSGIVVIIPPEPVLKLYHERTRAIYSQISKNICENRELTSIRDWLLPILMNGQAIIAD